MNHELIQQKLMALYDGPLTEKERKLLEGHLAQCADCRRAIAEWKAVSARLFPPHAFSEAAEDFFTTKVMDRIQATAVESAAFSWNLVLRWGLPLLGSAAVAAWVFFSVLPNITGLSTNNNLEAAFSYETPVPSSTGNGIMMASYTSQEIVP